ncbi:MAG: class I SAM-dependent methyltransferase, partial [Pirellulales bacterium]|nr:class I SAM-dependent methyltransferase [Pirellulales bacterium]
MRLEPQPSDAQLAQIYSESYFLGGGEDATLSLKQATARLQIAEISEFVRSVGGLPETPKVLEVGCGLGSFLIEARNAGFDIEGIDVSKSAVERANAMLGEPRARAGQLEEMNFADESFDLVVLVDVV